MSTLLQTEGRPLRRFRLSDVPLDVRLRAASILSRQSYRALPGVDDSLSRLLEAVLDVKASGSLDKALEDAARRPSDRVYWVSQEAWDVAVNGKQRERKRKARAA